MAITNQKRLQRSMIPWCSHARPGQGPVRLPPHTTDMRCNGLRKAALSRNDQASATLHTPSGPPAYAPSGMATSQRCWHPLCCHRWVWPDGQSAEDSLIPPHTYCPDCHRACSVALLSDASPSERQDAHPPPPDCLLTHR
jgi:hypothetical protein